MKVLKNILLFPVRLIQGIIGFFGLLYYISTRRGH